VRLFNTTIISQGGVKNQDKMAYLQAKYGNLIGCAKM